MNIKTIQEFIQRQVAIYIEPDASVSFCDSIFLSYRFRIITQLKEIFQNYQNEEELLKNLSLFLSNNWDLVKGSVLCYTALPENEITQLLCDVAQYIAQKHTDLAPIQILMPNIRCDSLFPNEYPNLDKADLTQVIKTHVLSQNCNFLIPVSLLADDNLATPGFPNIYFDCFNDDVSSQSLTDLEIKLLAQHSDETRAIWDAKKQYESVLEDKDSLLGQLNQLIKGLALNDATVRGQETDAGRHIYSDIINFNHYWQNLSCHKKLPAELVYEINILLNFATPEENPENNRFRNHNNLIETCIATRRKSLKEAISGHEELLAGISITAEQKQNRLDEFKKLLNEAKNNLRYCLKNNRYSGQDQQGITLKILDELKIELRLNNYTDLTDVLKGMNADEIKIICSLEDNSEKIVQSISTIEDLVILTTELNNEVLGALLNEIKNNIKTLIQSDRDVLALFIA